MRNGYITKRLAPPGYVAVTRPLAERLFNKHIPVTIAGNNVNSFHIFEGWHLSWTVSTSWEWCYAKTFDDVCKNALHYLEDELGTYLVFYVKKEDVK